MELKLKDEFYSLFDGYSKDEVNNALFLLDDFVIDKIMHTWNIDSEEEIEEKDTYFIFLIKAKLESGEIYKEDLRKYFIGYKKEEILAAFSSLDKIYREAILKIYILDDIKVFAKRVSVGDIELINYGINYINNYLVNNCKKNDFFSLFQVDNNYTNEEILLVFDIFPLWKKRIAYKKYGNSLLENSKNAILTDEEKRVMNFGIVRVMKGYLKKLREGYGVYSITDEFPGKTFLEIKEAIEKLDSKHQKYFYDLFGDDLKRKRQSLKINEVYIIQKEYKRKVELKFLGVENRKHMLKDFFSRFSYLKNKDESEEDFKEKIVKVIDTKLNSYCKDILFRAFGENYEEVNVKNINSKERKYLSVYIIPRIKYFVIKEEKQASMLFNFYSRIPSLFSLNEIEEVMILLFNDSIINLIIKVEMFTLDSSSAPVSLREMEEFNIILNRIISTLISFKSKKTNISRKTLSGICNLLNSNEYEKLKNLYGGNIALAILMSIYFTNVSYESIELLTGINSKTLLEYRSNYLEKNSVLIKNI